MVRPLVLMVGRQRVSTSKIVPNIAQKLTSHEQRHKHCVATYHEWTALYKCCSYSVNKIFYAHVIATGQQKWRGGRVGEVGDTRIKLEVGQKTVSLMACCFTWRTSWLDMWPCWLLGKMWMCWTNNFSYELCHCAGPNRHWVAAETSSCLHFTTQHKA